MLTPVWRGDAPVRETNAADHLAEARAHAKAEIEAVPQPLRALDGKTPARKLIASDGLVREIERLVAEAR
jgi:hypothetical protein